MDKHVEFWIGDGEVMTSHLETLTGDSYTGVSKDANHNIRHRHYRNVLKSKELYKNKCKRNLKKKLKKYKLRQDGKEDQDIIDVSNSLVSSLFIRSPDTEKNSIELEIENLRPKNYLFRMVRKKQATLKTSKASHNFDSKVKTLEENAATSTSTSPATEEKKTNAFKLLMESRNKSLGTNSPGKERPNEEAELNESSEKKSIKAKRNLLLQRMAEEKGSCKKKEIEEQHEKYINKKMEKRAEKLKSMILHKESKPNADEEKNKITSQKTRSPLDSIDTGNNGKILDKSFNTLQLVNIFNEAADKKLSSKKKLVTKEDEEFLDKLSPSIRKKESMLSYFKKIEKDSESSNVDAENDKAIIKVKLGTKSKKRGRKKKLSLNRDIEEKCNVVERTELDVEVIANNTIEIEDEIPFKTSASESSTERRKRKRNTKESTPSKDTLKGDAPDDFRPKRTTKKPVKYIVDVVLTSSDEELHIFTPKKKKHSEGKNKAVAKATDIIVIKDDINISKSDKKLDSNEKKSKNEKKPAKNDNLTKLVKLAPIFSKSQPDVAAIEAKQKFLQSGVPEQLKKLMSKQKDCNNFSNSFPVVVHVQQHSSTVSTRSLLSALNLSEETSLENFNFDSSEHVFTKMLNLETSQSLGSMQSKNNANTQLILQNLKETYPRFPVYRIYKLLRGKKKGEYKDSNIFSNLDNSIEILNCSIDMQNDNPDQLTWSDKYKPLSGNEIIGNFESIKELKKWLVTWTENATKSKVTNSNDSDSSDYYQSEPDSRDSMKSYNNLLILSGPVGCGKTSCVYAVAAELSMKVIEVNASSKRTGKIMLQDLQEATQSHKVNRGAGSSENSQRSQEMVEPLPEKIKKRGRPKKGLETPKKVAKEKLEVINGVSASQESTRTAMSLILIDDADIVFDQDDGFCSAIMQLVQSSKRPVILVTGSLTLPHLQKFLQSSKVLKMKALLPNMLGTWLDLMCLADSGTCWPGLGAKFLNFFNGDMRRTINCLQFYVGSQVQVLSVETNSQIDSQTNDVKINVDDENSCMSWTDSEITDDKNKNAVCEIDSQPIWDTFLNEHTHLEHMKCTLKMFDVWWSIPKVLNIDPHTIITQETINSSASLEAITNVLNSISICDFLSHKTPETEATMTSNPWYDAECDSVSELENLDHYDQKHDTTKKLCGELVKGSISSAQVNMGLENKYDFYFPGMSAKRQRDRIVTRHTDLTSFLSPQSSLDRKALALDYWPSCRAICRIERSKTDANSKRNNRFCHYLKSLSVQCKSESFDRLANSLNPQNN